MPKFRKLSDDEVKAILERPGKKEGPSRRELVRRQYAEYLSQYKPGDWVSVEPGEGETRITVKNRLNRAAEDLSYSLKFVRTRGAIKFQVARGTRRKKRKGK